MAKKTTAPAPAPAAKKKGVARSGFISKAPVRRLMKDEGASLVSDDALKLIIATLEDHAVKTTKKAIQLVKDEKRKRLTAEDINWATR